jgi:hypothetical protein
MLLPIKLQGCFYEEAVQKILIGQPLAGKESIYWVVEPLIWGFNYPQKDFSESPFNQPIPGSSVTVS